MSERIGSGPPQQPQVEQTGVPQPAPQGAGSIKPFSLESAPPPTAVQVPLGMKTALQNFMKTGAKEYQDPNTGHYYKISTSQDLHPPSGVKTSKLATVVTYDHNPAQGGKMIGTQEFGVAKTPGKYYDSLDVYTKPGNQEAQNLSTQSLHTIPNNMHDLMKVDPSEGNKIYHAFLVGIAMSIMNELKKHQRMFSQAAQNA
ncbi:MAG: hypothetical protein JSR80_03010 [Verrucomicrobia bacterium]|nr:hypothetical protein [Verrucomicrobiota bacterium]